MDTEYPTIKWGTCVIEATVETQGQLFVQHVLDKDGVSFLYPPYNENMDMEDINKLYKDYCPEDEKSYTCKDCSRQFIPTPDDNFSLTCCYSCFEEGGMWKDEDDDED